MINMSKDSILTKALADFIRVLRVLVIIIAAGGAFVGFIYLMSQLDCEMPKEPPKYDVACYDEKDSLIAVFMRCDISSKMAGAYTFYDNSRDTRYEIIPVKKIVAKEVK